MPKPDFRPAVVITPKDCATAKQISYLQVLFNDLDFTIAQRNSYLSRRLDREVKYLDDLTVKEAGKMIDRLVEEKNERRLRIGMGM